MASRNLWATRINALARSGMENIIKSRSELLEQLTDAWVRKKNNSRSKWYSLKREMISKEEIIEWQNGGKFWREGSASWVAERAFGEDYEVLAKIKMLSQISISSDHHIEINDEEWRTIERWSGGNG